MKTQTFKFDKWIKHVHPVRPYKFDYWYNIADCQCFGEKIFKIYPQFDGVDIRLEKEEDWSKSPDLFLLTEAYFQMSVTDAKDEKPVRAFGTFDEAVGRAGELVDEMLASAKEVQGLGKTTL
jgi:hypothetical protein